MPVELANRENPWIGLATYTEELAGYFHGRTRENAVVLGLIDRAVLTVVYGVSGLGKSSLLQAGVFPRLRGQESFPVWLRLPHEDDGRDAPRLASYVLKRLEETAAADAVEAPEFDHDATLWENFHREDARFWSARHHVVTPVLVLDQFEECFTLGGENPQRINRLRAFLIELSDLVENRVPESVRERMEHGDSEPAFTFDSVPLRVVFSLREDFLAPLHELRELFPSIGDHRFRLEPFTASQARAVIEQNGDASALLAPGFTEALLGFVSAALDRTPEGERKAETSAGSAAVQPLFVDDSEHLPIEPAYLSIILRELNLERQHLTLPVLTPRLLFETRSRILESFYERAFDGVDPGVRHFVEDELLTPSGFRGSRGVDEALAHPGITREALNTVVDRRLLRFEDRARGGPRLELTHDLLCRIVRDSRRERHERVEKEAEESRRRNEETLQRNLRRARLAAVGFAALAIFSLLTAVAAYYFYAKAGQREHDAMVAERRAKDQEHLALNRQHDAEVARRAETESRQVETKLREEADHLIEFTLKEVRSTFEKQGRLDLLSNIAKRANDYFDLPSEDGDSPARASIKADALAAEASVADILGEIPRATDRYEAQIRQLEAVVKNDRKNVGALIALSNACRNLSYLLRQDGPKENPGAAWAQKATDYAIQATVPGSKDAKADAAWAHALSLQANYKADEAYALEAQVQAEEARIPGLSAEEKAKAAADKVKAQAVAHDAEETAKQAEVLFKEAFAIIDPVVRTYGSNDDDAADSLSVVIWNYGQFLYNHDRLEEALTAFDRSLETDTRLSASQRNLKYVRYQVFSVSWKGVTFEALAHKNPAKKHELDQQASQNYQKAVDMADALTVQDSTNPQWWDILEDSCDKFASFEENLVEQGNLKGNNAIVQYRSAWKHRLTELAAGSKVRTLLTESARGKRYYSNTLSHMSESGRKFGDALFNENEFREALDIYRKAYDAAAEWVQLNASECGRVQRTNLAESAWDVERTLEKLGQTDDLVTCAEKVLGAYQFAKDKAPAYFEEDRASACDLVAKVRRREGNRAEEIRWLLQAANYDGSKSDCERLAEIYKTGDGVPKDTAQAAVWDAKAKSRRVKRLTVPMPVGGDNIPIECYLADEFVDGHNPLDEINRQLDYLRERGVFMPTDVSDSLRELYNIAMENKVSFIDLLTYALNHKEESPSDKLAGYLKSLAAARNTYAKEHTEANRVALANAYNSAADSAMYLKRWSDVELWARKASELDPTLSSAYGNLATSLLFQGHYGKALEIYRAHWNDPFDKGTLGEATLNDFAALEKTGITHPDIARISEAFGVKPK